MITLFFCEKKQLSSFHSISECLRSWNPWQPSSLCHNLIPATALLALTAFLLAGGDWERAIYFLMPKSLFSNVWECSLLRFCWPVSLSKYFQSLCFYRTIHYVALISFGHGTQQQNTISLASMNTKQKRKHILKQILLCLRSWNHSGHVLTAVLIIEEKSQILDMCRKLCPWPSLESADVIGMRFFISFFPFFLSPPEIRLSGPLVKDPKIKVFIPLDGGRRHNQAGSGWNWACHYIQALVEKAGPSEPRRAS